ncbi:PAP2 domain protein [Exophiala viscosa]|uniref:PAP2 domain protein n=1 Tax=Exophiala viscosa TaxID=2486360 RepID=UPI0021995349|nr:PAP2 domain protein [Exophiala viscosa]
MDWLRGRLNTPSEHRLPVRAVVSYIIDYLIIIILAVIYGFLDKLVTPFAQHFSLNNIYIQYPYAIHERVPIQLALIISGLFPAVVIAVYSLFIDGLFSHYRGTTRKRSRYSFSDRLWELHCGWLGLLLAQGAAFVITGTLKNLCGRPRPDLIDRCQPGPGSADGVPYGLVTKAICTQTDAAIMQDGFRSFPSGHSSSSFAGLFYLSLYLAAKLHVLDQKGEVWRTCIVLVPTLAASCIAMSRIMDARHHPFDVLFGSALGILCAWGSYRQYFPPVSHVWEKGRAYPMRIWGTPVRRPVPGKVLIDSDTLEVLHDRVPADINQTSSYEMTGRNLQTRAPRQDFQSHSITPSLDMDVEAGYQLGQQPPGPLQHTDNAFRQQMEQNRRTRAGYAGSSPEPEAGGTDDEDEFASRKPLQPSGLGG